MWAASRSTYSDPIAAEVKHGVNGYNHPSVRPDAAELLMSNGDHSSSRDEAGILYGQQRQ